MARQGDYEASDSSNSRLDKALKVIIESYNGIPAERLYRDAIYCFESLIEISRNTEDIIDFARRNDMDSKYLVDGANFLISKMHFNPEGNFYITLGLPKNVTHNEIRARWKKLMLLYHPDRQLGAEEWVYERAKKVNEAYSVLKDDDQRHTYDLQLLEKSSSQHSVLQPNVKSVPVSSRDQRPKTSDNLQWDRKKKYIPRVILGLYVLAALTFLGYIAVANNSEMLESALTAKPDKDQPADQITGQEEIKVPVNTLSTQPLARAYKKKADGSFQSFPKTEHLSENPGEPAAFQTGNKQTEIPTRSENRQEAPFTSAITTSKKTLPMNASDIKRNKQDRVHEAEAEGLAFPSKVITLPEKNTNETGLHAKTDNMNAFSVKTVEGQNSIELTEEEVERFMRLYSTYYLKNDIDAFMSLFSESAIENNRLHYDEIRSVYRETFSEKTNYYKINNMTIVIDGQIASVSGVYDLSRYITALNRWMRYSGQIQWKIAKENNMLKIVRLNYD